MFGMESGLVEMEAETGTATTRAHQRLTYPWQNNVSTVIQRRSLGREVIWISQKQAQTIEMLK